MASKSDPDTPELLRELEFGRLVGLSIERAREIVQQARGELRPVPPGYAVRLDYRPNRVTVDVDSESSDARVIRVRGIG